MDNPSNPPETMPLQHQNHNQHHRGNAAQPPSGRPSREEDNPSRRDRRPRAQSLEASASPTHQTTEEDLTPPGYRSCSKRPQGEKGFFPLPLP